jgi:hypothetical protein
MPQGISRRSPLIHNFLIRIGKDAIPKNTEADKAKSWLTWLEASFVRLRYGPPLTEKRYAENLKLTTI